MQIEQWAVTKSLCHTAFKVFFLQNEMKMKEHLSYKEQRPKKYYRKSVRYQGVGR